MAKRLGKYAEQPKRWEENTVINMLHLLTPNALSLIIDCGTEDFFFEVNQKTTRTAALPEYRARLHYTPGSAQLALLDQRRSISVAFYE
jgi:hypothetical protein